MRASGQVRHRAEPCCDISSRSGVRSCATAAASIPETARRPPRQIVDRSGAVELVELADAHVIRALTQSVNDVQELVAVRGGGPFGRQPHHEAFHVAPKLQQRPFPREIHRRDLEVMAGPDEDERVGGQTADSLIDRCSTDTDRVLQFLHRQQQPGLQGAGDYQLLQPVVSELSQVHAIGARGLLPAPPGRS